MKMPSGKKHKEFKTSSSGSAEVVLGGGTYMKKETPGNVLGKISNIFVMEIYSFKANPDANYLRV